MPNWCGNFMVVAGPKADVVAFVNRAEAGDGISFAQAIEAARLLDPDASEAELEEAAAVISPPISPLSFWHHAPIPGGTWKLDLATETWSTKWEPCRIERSELPAPGATARVAYRFDTAWDPPKAWMVAASRTHPTVEMYLLFNEEGGRHGALLVAAGEVAETALSFEELCEEWPDPPYPPYVEEDE